jgi:glycosyltransferase involved in cell wall biosynthesis
MDISVVIPTFRRPALLAEALASVLSQIGVTVEVLVVDDCQDGSARAAVEAVGDARVTYISNPNPTGGKPSVVRNLGWPRTRGTYIHFLDDDDIVPEGHYSAVKAAFERHPHVGFVFGRIKPFGACPPDQLEHERNFFASAARNAARCGALGRYGRKFAFTARILFGPAMLVCSAAVIRRDCVDRVGGFDPKMTLMEDTDLFLRMARSCGAFFLDRPTLHYRIGSPSLMHSPNPPPEQRAAEKEGDRHLRAKYRRDHGILEFFVLRVTSRLFLRIA